MKTNECILAKNEERDAAKFVKGAAEKIPTNLLGADSHVPWQSCGNYFCKVDIRQGARLITIHAGWQ